MAATRTVAQAAALRKSGETINPTRTAGSNSRTPIKPRHGVVTLFGYGIKARVDRGHLVLEDGVGDMRREGRFPRIGHGIQRLVVIGSDGMISLAAIRWLADQKAGFVMLERDGSVLLTTGPIAPSDVRLRRAQACAHLSDAALLIARELIDRKLAGQETVVRAHFQDAAVAEAIASFRSQLGSAKTVVEVRNLESLGGVAYWARWRHLTLRFPKSELPRVPLHWQTFGPRHSPISGSCRNAANPGNAILNYLYAILEAEARLCAAALGLDPGFGVIHADDVYRDSLACDLMEVLRPNVDAFLLDWIGRTTFKREWFFEQRDGGCRLMGPFTALLSETALRWHEEFKPLVEWFADAICATAPNAGRLRSPGTRLTRLRWRERWGPSHGASKTAAIISPTVCKGCGTVISTGRNHCEACAVDVAKEQLVKVRAKALEGALSAASRQRRSETHRRQNAGRRAWQPSDLPEWLDNDFYVSRIQPCLVRLTRDAIARTLEVSRSWASDIRAGTRIPHPRHWVKLVEMVGITIPS